MITVKKSAEVLCFLLLMWQLIMLVKLFTGSPINFPLAAPIDPMKRQIKNTITVLSYRSVLHIYACLILIIRHCSTYKIQASKFRLWSFRSCCEFFLFHFYFKSAWSELLCIISVMRLYVVCLAILYTLNIVHIEVKCDKSLVQQISKALNKDSFENIQTHLNVSEQFAVPSSQGWLHCINCSWTDGGFVFNNINSKLYL